VPVAPPVAPTVPPVPAVEERPPIADAPPTVASPPVVAPVPLMAPPPVVDVPPLDSFEELAPPEDNPPDPLLLVEPFLPFPELPQADDRPDRVPINPITMAYFPCDMPQPYHMRLTSTNSPTNTSASLKNRTCNEPQCIGQTSDKAWNHEVKNCLTSA
jgi:hypothetical protein